MQKEYKNIDDLFKSELSGLNTSAPESVKQKIDQRIKMKKYFFISTILLLLISISAISYTSFINSDNTITSNQSTKPNQEQITPATDHNYSKNITP